MSFSFQARAVDKAVLREIISAKMDEVIVGQPIHAADKAPVIAAADVYLNFLADDPDKDVQAHISGSLNWTGTQESPVFTGASLNVSVYQMPRA